MLPKNAGLVMVAVPLALCSCSLVAPRPTLDDALLSYNWDAHSEADFWTQHPQFVYEYGLMLEDERRSYEEE